MENYNGISPTGYRVLIEPDQIPEEVTASGIVIPLADREKHQQAQTTGVIRAIGPAAWQDKTEGAWADIGDRVVYDKYTGLAIAGLDGTEYRLVNDTQVIAVVDSQIKLDQLQRRVAYER